MSTHCVIIIGGTHLLVETEKALSWFRELDSARILDTHYGSGYTVDNKATIQLRMMPDTELAKLLLGDEGDSHGN